MASPPSPPLRLALPGILWVLAVYAALWLALAPYHRHLTVSVETDFPQYARLALEEPRWHPHRPVGYPRLLAWTSLLAGDVFRAGVLLSALGGAWFLAAAHVLARRRLAPAAAAYATLLLALNWLVVQNALLAGTDLLWTAAVVTAFGVLLRARDAGSRDLHGLAGVVLGLSYDLRYATAALVPLFAVVALASPRAVPLRARASRAGLLVFGALLGALPQLWIAVRDTGNPLASGAAQNVWFGMFGDRDWPARWGDAPRDATLVRLAAEHPAEFASNLASNLWAAVRLAVLAPFGMAPVDVVRKPELALAAGASLVAAAAGLAGTTWRRRLRATVAAARRSTTLRAAAWIAAGYVVAVSLAFWFTRFFLPVTVLLVLGGAIAARRVLWTPLARRPALRAALALAAPVLLVSHSASAWSSLLRTQQQPVEEVSTALAAAGIRAGDVVAATVAEQYDSLLPFEFDGLSLEVQDLEDLQLALALSGASFFLHEERRAPDRTSYRPVLDELFEHPDLCPFLEPLWMRLESPRVILFRAR